MADKKKREKCEQCDIKSLSDCPMISRYFFDSAHPSVSVVNKLLECRGFLWDTLTEGEWTGCSRPLLRKLKEIYGDNALFKAFGSDIELDTPTPGEDIEDG